MRKSLYLLALQVLLANSLFAQSKATVPENSKYLQLTFENGAMLGNGTELGDQIVNSSYYNGLELKYSWQRHSPDLYSQLYRFPKLGVGFYSSTFHNEAVGRPNALFVWGESPFTYPGLKRWYFSYTGAFGISYNFNPYDAESNPTNIFIGSYRNCYVHLGFYATYKLAKYWDVKGGLGFKHFSNGSYSQPNYGINLFPAQLAVSYRVSRNEPVYTKRDVPDFIDRNIWNISIGAGSKSYSDTISTNYLKTVLSVNYLRQLWYKHSIGIGVDMFYSGGLSDREPSVTENTFGNSTSFAIVPSGEWMITRNIYVPMGIGFYLDQSKINGEETFFYERVGLRFRVQEHLFAGVTIKAHKGVADFFEFTVGYSIGKDENKY